MEKRKALGFYEYRNHLDKTWYSLMNTETLLESALNVAEKMKKNEGKIMSTDIPVRKERIEGLLTDLCEKIKGTLKTISELDEIITELEGL